MRYFIFIFFLILLSSCGGDPIIENACSPSNVRGECEKENDVCYKGVCIDKDAECDRDNIMAPCENKTTHYCKKNNEDVYECLPYLCSFSRPTGYCANEQTCVAGECVDVCSETNPTGKCISNDAVSLTHTCISGVCYLNTEKCSAANQTGVCTLGFVCHSGTCEAECSVTNLQGACTEGKSCVEGYCLTTSNLCNQNNSNGECPPGKTCYQYECKYSCSESHEDGYCTDATKMCRDGRCQYECTQTRPNGVCEDPTYKCVNGDCTPPCSLDEVEGYCETDMLCINGTCEFLCSSTHLDGYCDEGTACIDGNCQFPCSGNHLDGYCEGDYKVCIGGLCVAGCSPENVTGPCERSDFYCDPDFGICVEYPCGTMNLDGPCTTADQRCISGVCKSRCSATTPTGYCTIPGFVCSAGQCIDPVTAPCSAQFPSGYCEQEHYECVSGTCLEEACSVSYPTGRCPAGKNCENGTCVAPQICSDGRPLDGLHGACCQTNDDCAQNDVCIEDNTEGNYCLDFFNQEGYPGYCINDVQCSDPYSAYGETQEYFCTKGKMIYEGVNYNFSMCQRLSDFCGENLASVRTKNAGESCDMDGCGNAQCKNGLFCSAGICVPACNLLMGEENNIDCSINGMQLDCINGDVYMGEYNNGANNQLGQVTHCENICKSNSDCIIPNTDCKKFTPLYSQGKYGVICDIKLTTGRELGQFCSTYNDCKSQLCNVNDNKCSTHCNSDDDCQGNGLNGYCHYDFNLTAQEGSVFVGNQQMGYCRYLDSTSTLQTECSHKSDCAVLGSNYYCLPKYNENSVSGECGILDRARSYRGIGLPCDNSTFYCETDLCIGGKCQEYCTETSQCGANNYCQIYKFRDDGVLDGNQINLALYGGACTFKTGSMTQCANSIFPCSDNETCRYNLPRIVDDSSEVEYICMAKETVGNIIGASCTEDSNCQTGHCHPVSKICTTACKTDTQCEDVLPNGFCDPEAAIVIYSDNPNDIVYGGLCDN